jgi:hypothetical protein
VAGIDIETLFRAKSASIRELLSDLVDVFAIPTYQRPYRWEPAQVRRLLEDLINGLNRIAEDPDAVAFIGAVITVNGVAGPHITKPAGTKSVIDGQQRLTTLLLTAAAAHQLLGELMTARAEVGQSGSPEDVEFEGWLTEQLTEVRGQLLSCLAEKREFGDEDFRYLPKLIRDFVDVWSNKQETARYASPIANLLHRYVRAQLHNEPLGLDAPAVVEVPEAFGAAIDDDKIIRRRFLQTRRYVKEIADGRKNEILEAVDLTRLSAEDAHAFGSLFEPSPPNVDLSPDSGRDSVLRLLMFSRFLLDRVSITHINASSEGYAFDLFDALNTTGEPLTAFETFVPLVVEAEGVTNYHGSPSFHDVALTGKLLAGEGSKVQGETARLVTTALLAEHGAKVGTRLSEQRWELSKRYRDAPNLDARRAITRQFADSAVAYFRLWKSGRLAFDAGGTEPVRALGATTEFALRFATAINHTVLVAPLSRFMAQFRADPGDETQSELERAIRASVAFSALWRAMYGGTAGIDDIYRGLMQKGWPADKEEPDRVVTGLARTSPGSYVARDLPSVDTLIEAFWAIAGAQGPNSFVEREDWVDRVSRRPLYEQTELAKFLLLISGHHAVPKGTTGLLQDGNAGDHTEMLRPDRWGDDERFATVEHVAPQTPNISEDPRLGWAPKLYSDPTTIHQIGNLTLVPLARNATLGNRPWPEKRFLYRALSADGPADAEAALDAAEEAGFELSEELRGTILARREHLIMLQTIARFDGAWSAEFVDQRSRSLLSRAWSVLAGWLS